MHDLIGFGSVRNTNLFPRKRETVIFTGTQEKSHKLFYRCSSVHRLSLYELEVSVLLDPNCNIGFDLPLEIEVSSRYFSQFHAGFHLKATFSLSFFN